MAGRSDAKERGLGNWRAQGGIPEDRWSEAQALVDNIARDYGFNSGPVVVKDNPSDHYVTFYDPYKAQLTFGSAVNTVLLLRTGCHLTPEGKQRGELSPTRTY